MKTIRMSRNSSRIVARLLAILFIAWVSAAALEGEVRLQKSNRPNILFMFTDDQPQNCLGCLGNPHIETPNLDRLARRGSLFDHAFVTTAICCSNRACILTGQYMRRHGIRDFQTPLSAAAFDQTYPALLKKAGYRTGYLGKFAIGSPRPEVRSLSLPKEKFDDWYGFPQAINFLQKIDGEDHYLTDVMTTRAIEFLRASQPDQPFCLTVAFKEPHGPMNYFDPDVPHIYENVDIPPPPTFTRQSFHAQPEFIRESLNGGNAQKWFSDSDSYQQYVRSFYRLITRVDIAVGEILDALHRFGLDENTVVIFSSDHGSMLGAHGLTGKWIMYEESIRIPLIIFDPRKHSDQQGSRHDEMALSIDIAPTILTLAGVSIPACMQGRSLTPLIDEEQTEWRDDWYYEHVYNTRPPRRPIVETEGVRTGRWKYIRYPGITPPYEQLFDLKTDPREEQNLASRTDHRNTLSTLRDKCNQYRQQLK